jgi:O-antigen/teichoic acid export membrane protein
MKFIEKFISASTFKDLSTLIGGTAISAVIPIITAPIMARLFSPENYGLLAVFLSVNGLISVVLVSGYSQAIMLPKNVLKAKQIVWFSLFITLGISILCLIFIGLLFLYSNFSKTFEISIWFFLIPFTVFFGGVASTLNIWANRVKEYKNIAKNRITQALLTAGIQIFLGIVIKGETGLLIGLVFGQVYSAVALVLVFYYKKSANNIGSPIIRRFRSVANDYKKLVLFSTPSEFINNLINQMPIFLLTYFGGISGQTLVGNFSFTQRFLGLPQQFLSSSIVDIFKQKAADNYRESENCRPIFVKTAKVLTLLAIIPFIIFFLFAPQIFIFVFGDKWFLAGVFSKYLSILFFLRFIVSPLSYTFILAGKFTEDFLIHLIFFVTLLVGFYIGNYFLEDKKYLVLVYSLIYSSIYILYFVRSYKFSKTI